MADAAGGVFARQSWFNSRLGLHLIFAHFSSAITGNSEAGVLRLPDHDC